MMLFSPFEEEARPGGVATTRQVLSFTEVTILVLIKQRGQTWQKYPRINDALATNREKLLTVITTPGLTSFLSYTLSHLLFSERPIGRH